MKILHTSDWHIGKRLHQIDLAEDHRRFFDWLIQTIKTEQVDALIISGDIFDLANPSSEARRMYYEVLVELSRLGVTVIITGGNHDSPSVLNAPKHILQALNIHVIGGLPEDPKEMLVPLTNKNGQQQAVIAAIPYLRDTDLRRAAEGTSYEDRIDAIRQGITSVFSRIAEYCKKKYPGIPAIAMGHLFAQGATTSDSEREIQVGNLAEFDPVNFTDYFDFIALGHIHRPQPITNSEHAHYSGSPIPLSFSEKSDPKRVIIYDLSTDQPFHKSIKVPEQRKLIKIQGTYEEIYHHLQNKTFPDNPLPTLIEIEMIEQSDDPQKVAALEELIATWNNPKASIIKHRIQFLDAPKGTGELYDTSKHIEELDPVDVFDKKMERSGIAQEQKQMLKEAFHEILEHIYQSDAL